MSVTRLILMDSHGARSGLIPSRGLGALLWALANGAKTRSELWAKIEKVDSGVQEFFESNLDSNPVLEGVGDGLLVINWDHCCIESFQEFQPIRREGVAYRHNGCYSLEEDPVPYQLGDDWHLIDHQF